MKIAIVTTGRFHVCDLARELVNIGHDVKFYSLVPPWRTEKFGLPKRCARWVLPYIPFAGLRVKLAKDHKWKRLANENLTTTFDKTVARMIEPCDVVIGMSGMCNHLGATVKNKFGAQLWIERGSRHILSQKEILSRGPDPDEVSDFAVERELYDYAQADTIVVLSKHCEESFLDHGTPSEKLFRNPLGVDLNAFSPTVAPNSSPPRIIMTGTWCWRKGCDTLIEAWKSMGRDVELIHVGPVGDLPLPALPKFIHYDKVDQLELIKYYGQAIVFALASREEGLATVQPQALACGLRIVCTDRTGGEDLRNMIANKSLVRVVPTDSVGLFADALQAALKEGCGEIGLRNVLSSQERHELSWIGSATRYSEELCNRISGFPSP